MSVSHDSETPTPGQQVFSVCGFIHQNFDGVEKLFLAKRAKTKKFLPDIYELPGGHVNFGEDMVTGLKREVLEELKVSIDVGDPFYVFTYANDIKKSHTIEVIYFAHFTSPLEFIQIDPEDHSEYKWITEREIDAIFTTASKPIDDDEVLAIKKGFALIKSVSLRF
jgi:8-oxo-dGTP diphosphatase